MTVDKIIDLTGYRLLTNTDTLENDCVGMYVSDLLSFVIGRASSDTILITVISNINTIAVAMLVDIKAILFTEGIIPTDDMIEKANEEGIALLTTDISSYEAVLSLDKIGV